MIAFRALALAAGLALVMPAAAQDLRQRPPEDEVIYFVLPDRFANADPANDTGGIRGDRLRHGFDPTHKGFYHGGDLKGLIARLDYIQSLGATAIWLTPVFKNKAVQGAPGEETSGYHGYWITDFTTVDPHLGSEADFKALVDAAHERGMKVYMDIIANHTADVIHNVECGDRACDYRGRADYPYSTVGGVDGAPINPGFAGDRVMTADNFARLTNPNFAYTPRVAPGERQVKVPAWLNDPIYYHNRGNSTFEGESSTMGDFSGLDDLMTEHPRVVQGMIDVYASWIDRFGVDGFRIDTARHVNPEFWAAFAPAMLERAKARGISNFHIFGEAAYNDLEPGLLARHTIVDKLPSVLDFAFSTAVRETVAGDRGTERLARLFEGDALYAGGEPAALRLPTFIGNHDQGRFSTAVRQGHPRASEAEIAARVRLGHAMLLLLRGVPTIYYGDEQGFSSDGRDQDAREDMFPTRVASYLDNRLVGTDRSPGADHFADHPLRAAIAELARLRTGHAALRRGLQLTRAAGKTPGLFAVSRFDPDDGREYLIAFNTAATPWSGQVEVDPRRSGFAPLGGTCTGATLSAPGSVALALAPFAYCILASGK
ncbi:MULTISPECIES: alpha-amylase family glycosyl hydrolase [unclassified Sphingomonas]|jgi:glycosidase|uniref:alpha-amylase family glycosyl hydrolase n=1 Tax=unclassified Sphingomonas TaxID=196159 RepID=UPI0008366795|nr:MULTISPECIES: alpha-amylase family glycosyl hydrolase [unclassified Sphingomonas]